MVCADSKGSDLRSDLLLAADELGANFTCHVSSSFTFSTQGLKTGGLKIMIFKWKRKTTQETVEIELYCTLPFKMTILRTFIQQKYQHHKHHS